MPADVIAFRPRQATGPSTEATSPGDAVVIAFEPRRTTTAVVRPATVSTSAAHRSDPWGYDRCDLNTSWLD